MARVTSGELAQLAADALRASGASDSMARTTAKYLVAADSQGLATHGVARISTYCAHLRNGRAQGSAVPRVLRESGATCLIDARFGLGFEPCELAVEHAVRRAQSFGVGFAGVTNSHHCGALGVLVEPAARLGLVALAFSTAPAAIAPWGGKRPLFGTNPVAAVFPRRSAQPLVVDLSLTQVTRGQILLLKKAGKPVPEGWGMDADGRETTDPDKILFGGSLHAIGGAKGAMLALAVELICCALTGAALSKDLESLHLERGAPLKLGQAFIVLAPAALAGNDTYDDRVEALVSAMLEQDGVRLPGERRHRLAGEAQHGGIDVSDEILRELSQLARAGEAEP